MILQRLLIGLFVLLLLTGVSISAQQRTEVKNARAARMLLGKHLFSLQWISWDHFGNATVTNDRGVYRLKGEQKGRGNADYVRINGVVTRVEARSFTFNGTIETRVSHINGGEPCLREGEMTFAITGTRRYWRLQQMDNPCHGVVDYVDIYFRR